MLATCRSLQRAGYDVTAASFSAFAPAQWSRSCKRRLRVTDAREGADQFVQELQQELARCKYAALIAGSDSALLAVSGAREHLQELVELGLPSRSVVERALSREGLAEAAEEAGFTPAASVRCAGVDQALAATRRLGFPVVLKAAEAARMRGRACVRPPKARTVFTEAELVLQAPGFDDDLLVQQWVGGDVVSFGGVSGDGRLLAVAVSRYRRMWPPDGGSVTFGETIVPPEGLEEMVERLLAIVGWEGIFELELLDSGASGYVPVDLNPRPYGSMALATAAGAPLATIWCDWLLRRSAQPARANPHHYYRWGDGDLRHLAWQLRRGHYRLAMDVLLPHRHVTNAHFELTDPLPLLARGLYLVKRASCEWRDVGERQ